MKTVKDCKSLLLLIMMAALSVNFTACSNNDDDDDAGNNNDSTVSIDESVQNARFYITRENEYTAQEIADEVFGPDGANGDDEQETVRRAFLSKQQKLADEKANELGANSVVTGYRSFNYDYESVDEQGNPIMLSARVFWGAFLGLKDMDPDYIILSPHITIGSNAECPTSKLTYEAMAMIGDNLLIMPDYKGFGTTKDQIQPYINHNLCAIHSLDALKAGYKLFLDKSSSKLEKNWKLYVIGASQGGGNSLAIHKWLDTHLDEAEQWRFAYSYCCSGPYCPGLTFETYFEQKKHPYPCVFPFTIKAMMAAYPEILGKWQESDFYSTDYVKNHMDEMNWMVNSKEYSCSKINEMFFKWYPHEGDKDIKSGKELLLSDILSEEMLDKNSEMYKALMECLDKNDLTKGWTPIHDIKLYHGPGDEIVPYANSEAVVKAFPDKATLTASGWGVDGHIGTCVKWLGQILINYW